jgi:DNA helicase-2/ATP-dependent DNA helicase PcrA
MTTDLVSGLNEKQYAAVTAGAGPILVLAGPGSGKTGVLTRRVAFLIQEMQVKPWHIMAVTFTNKAAGEMRHRISGFLGGRIPGLQIGTVHATCG